MLRQMTRTLARQTGLAGLVDQGIETPKSLLEVHEKNPRGVDYRELAFRPLSQQS